MSGSSLVEVAALLAVALGVLAVAAGPAKKDGKVEDAAGAIEILVLYDNNPYASGLETGWGFSCLVRGLEKTILFDTGGDGDLLLANMHELGVDPREIDSVVLSHAHGDHTGGVEALLGENHDVTIHLLSSFPEGLKSRARSLGADVVEIDGPAEIVENARSTGPLGGGIEEQALVVRTKAGLVVITGCSHPGIVKTVASAKDEDDDVLLVMGGFHLGSKNASQIGKVIDGLVGLGVSHAGPCHCSGDLARKLMKKRFSGGYVEVGVGRAIATDAL
jgi:7,8-dihydropterin-6-yl-methyl-4-(beta-D-ribofuranosyl)aminobenzene 5'-phosphate synthase